MSTETDKQIEIIAKAITPLKEEEPEIERLLKIAVYPTAKIAEAHNFDNDVIEMFIDNVLMFTNYHRFKKELVKLVHDEIREIARDRAEQEEYNRLYSEPTPDQIAGEIQDDIISMYRRER